MVPALSIDRKQIFRFSQIFASFFAGIFEKDDNLNASIQGAETLASLYLLYSADSARQKNSVDSFITGTRWLLRLADQFRLIENQRIKRQKRRQVGSALLALESGTKISLASQDPPDSYSINECLYPGDARTSQSQKDWIYKGIFEGDNQRGKSQR
jgi:hypothetical protein